MGASRRARRVNGRVHGAGAPGGGGARAAKAAGGVRKAGPRAARKAALLAAAREARGRRAAGPPALLALLPLSVAAARSLGAVRAMLDGAAAAAAPAAAAASARGGGSGSGTRMQALCVARRRGDEPSEAAGVDDSTWAREWMLAALDAAKIADAVVLLFGGTEGVDAAALDVIAALRAQGLPQVCAAAVGDGAADAALRRQRGRELAAESLGEDADLRPINLGEDGGAERIVRRCVDRTVKPLAWRRRYGYLLVEEASLLGPSAGACPADSSVAVELQLHGCVRGAGLTANQLVMITGVGAFKISRIIAADSGQVLAVRDEAVAEPIESEAPVDPLAGEQNWPPEVDNEEMSSKPAKRLVPKGFSEYQAAWLPDDTGSTPSGDVTTRTDASDAVPYFPDTALSAESPSRGRSGSDVGEDFADNGSELDEEEEECMGEGDALEESETQEDTLKEDDDEDMEVDEEEVARVRAAARENTEFPDEVDTPVDIPARVRFARYRGLKSLRTSSWDPKELLPRAYARLFQFANLRSTRKRVLAEAESRTRSVDAPAGHRVVIVLSEVDPSVAAAVVQTVRDGHMPVVASGMLRHENRKSVIHFGLQRVDDADGGAVKSKSVLEIHCGFARFLGRPMFSEQNANSDKHKMERYFVHGRYTVASFYGPAIYAPAPALLFHPGGGLIATGSALGADPDRIILKRIVLTGYPFKTQKKRVVVKFMFFNPEDVRWFRPVELWTKLGRTGHIVESLGTHGRMKCIFDATVLHHDTVCLTLYKRVYPKSVEPNDEE